MSGNYEKCSIKNITGPVCLSPMWNISAPKRYPFTLTCVWCDVVTGVNYARSGSLQGKFRLYSDSSGLCVL